MVFSGRLWKLFIVGGVFVLATSGLTIWLALREQDRWRAKELSRQLLVQAQLARDAIQGEGPAAPATAVPPAIQTLEREGVLVVVLAPNGAALHGRAPALAGSNLLIEPEVEQALRTGAGAGTRRWPDGNLYAVAAVRLGETVRPAGVVWLARPVTAIAGDPEERVRLLALGGGLAAAATVVFVAIVVRFQRRVFQRVIATARSLSLGDLPDVPEVAGDDELAVMSATLGALRERLASQVDTIDHQRRMLHALLDQLREGVIVARADGRIALLNPAAARLLNLSLEADGAAALAGRPVETCVPQHTLQVLLLGAEGDAAGGEEGAPGARLEVQTPGGLVHLLVHASRLVVAEGGPEAEAEVGRVVVLMDVTELQRTIQMRTDFVANASHELRTPLATIRAAAETMLSMNLQAEEPAARQFLGKIDRQTARLQQMVADLLDLSRIESPTERFEVEEIEIRRLLGDLEGRFADAVERKQLHWETEVVPPDALHVAANPHLLRLVLDNLVDNAIKFTEPGGHVRVTVRREREAATVEVADDGCGIAPEEQERVFERFYQVQRSRSGAERGTGLGLSIVRHAAEAMQARLRLESAAGQGTRVSVRVPQADASDKVIT